MSQVWQGDVAEARRGDLGAFERVVQQFQGMAAGYAYAVLGDFGLAEDAAQEAFLRAYCGLDETLDVGRSRPVPAGRGTTAPDP